MTEERLAGLTMMAVHYAEYAQINSEEIVRRLSQANPRHTVVVKINLMFFIMPLQSHGVSTTVQGAYRYRAVYRT